MCSAHTHCANISSPSLSHFDAVSSLVFHPTEQVLVTGSDDSTLKVWNLQRASQSSRNNRIVDLEPTHTYRGHVGAVLCVGMSVDGSVCYSGGVDSSIRAWRLPSDSLDPFDPYGESNLSALCSTPS